MNGWVIPKSRFGDPHAALFLLLCSTTKQPHGLPPFSSVFCMSWPPQNVHGHSRPTPPLQGYGSPSTLFAYVYVLLSHVTHGCRGCVGCTGRPHHHCEVRMRWLQGSSCCATSTAVIAIVLHGLLVHQNTPRS